MARKKEYDKEKVLDLATELFWEKGYKATSISDIVKATGLNKHSMYEEFKNKEGLFKETLFNYTNKLQKDTIGLLTKEPLGLRNIEEFLLDRVCYSTSAGTKGCMVINSIAEKESMDCELFSCVENLAEAFEGRILACLEAAQKNNEISSTKDLKVIAKYIVNFSSGVMLNGKLGQSREEYIAMLDFLMDSIKN